MASELELVILDKNKIFFFFSITELKIFFFFFQTISERQ